MLVVKIGGSLLDAAGQILAEIPRDRDILIVPGGGVFADFVREKDPDCDTAHFDAILSMNRYGRFLSTFGFPVSTEPKTGGKAVIFLPYDYCRKHDVLPHSWDVTSDSIAAWIAEEGESDLLLVKSVSAEFGPELSGSDIVDPYIFSIVKEHPEMTVRIANGRIAGEITRALDA
ncbi:MAG TPA: uridylate kinase [Methanocorpusculum sp.]|nr:uridylate kinase [Methanocorpusculum sp.]